MALYFDGESYVIESVITVKTLHSASIRSKSTKFMGRRVESLSVNFLKVDKLGIDALFCIVLHRVVKIIQLGGSVSLFILVWHGCTLNFYTHFHTISEALLYCSTFVCYSLIALFQSSGNFIFQKKMYN